MNQFILRVGNTIAFQSYDSTIAVVDRDDNTVTIFPDWDYSVTTGKHRNIFFRDYAYIPELATKKGIEKALKDGICGRWKVIKTAQDIENLLKNVLRKWERLERSFSFSIMYLNNIYILLRVIPNAVCVAILAPQCA